MVVNKMRAHVKQHNMTITEYKNDKLKGNAYSLIEKVLHRCKICNEIILLDSDSIASHLHTHNGVIHAVYNANYMTKDRPRTPNSTRTTAHVMPTQTEENKAENKESKHVGWEETLEDEEDELKLEREIKALEDELGAKSGRQMSSETILSMETDEDPETQGQLSTATQKSLQS